MCHPLPLTKVDISFQERPDEAALELYATVATTYVTGVEMEAMTAASVAALTIYDMTKALDKAIEIKHVHLVEKTGGKSGTYHRNSKQLRRAQESRPSKVVGSKQRR